MPGATVLASRTTSEDDTWREARLVLLDDEKFDIISVFLVACYSKELLCFPPLPVNCIFDQTHLRLLSSYLISSGLDLKTMEYSSSNRQ